MVSGAALQKLIGDLAVPVGARELRYGFSVPLKAEPFHAIQDRRDRLLVIAFAVGVLDAQQELAASTPGVEPIEEGRARAADMQVTGRRRRKSNDGRIGCRGLRHRTFSLICH